MAKRYFLETAYKGTEFNGWQIQKGGNTIQGKINNALSTILNQPIETSGASRTDAGVHARQNFAHFDFNGKMPNDLLYRINFFLPKEIAIKRVFRVEENAHSRFDAISRSYEYIIYFQKDPFSYEFGYFYPYPKPDVGIMKEGASFLKECKDFSAFCKSKVNVKTTICHIESAKWNYNENETRLYFCISANRFLRGMIRGIVGTLIQLGRKNITMEEFQNIVKEGRRKDVDFSVPPEGLYLTSIKYPYN